MKWLQVIKSFNHGWRKFIPIFTKKNILSSFDDFFAYLSENEYKSSSNMYWISFAFKVAIYRIIQYYIAEVVTIKFPETATSMANTNLHDLTGKGINLKGILCF